MDKQHANFVVQQADSVRDCLRSWMNAVLRGVAGSVAVHPAWASNMGLSWCSRCERSKVLYDIEHTALGILEVLQLH